MNTNLICHVCGKEKEPYTVILNNDIFSLILYQQAREEGEICQRCYQYYAMTGELKQPTEEEFEIAKKAARFAQIMLKWWIKDTPLKDGKNKREWEGTQTIAKWYREKQNERRKHSTNNNNNHKHNSHYNNNNKVKEEN